METIMLGSLNISTTFIVLIVALLTGYFVLKWRIANSFHSGGAELLNLLTNTLIMSILVWKLSPLVLDFSIVIHDLMSLIYLNGGRNGLYLALLYAAVSLCLSTWRKQLPWFLLPDLILTWYLAFSVVHGVLNLIISTSNLFIVYTSGNIIFSLILLVFQFKKGKHKPSRPVLFINLTLGYSLGSILLTFSLPQIESVFIGLTSEQLFFLSIAIVSFVLKIIMEAKSS